MHTSSCKTPVILVRF